MTVYTTYLSDNLVVLITEVQDIKFVVYVLRHIGRTENCIETV